MSRPSNWKLSVVVPAYNEADNIPEFLSALCHSIIHYPDYEVIIVNDGSSDNTVEILRTMRSTNNRIKYISLSRNFGHQAALKSGLERASGDVVISMDADLQHPPSMIPDMISLWLSGYDVVITVRDDSETPLIKRGFSSLFYKIMNYLSDTPLIPGAADFRLLDRQACHAICSFQENSFFLRGLVSWIGFRQTTISYSPDKRRHGQTKYSYFKMLRLARDGLLSFSAAPLRLSLILGLVFSGSGFLYAIYSVLMHILWDATVTGWTSLMMCVLFLGGVQLIMLGVVGEYIGRIFMETKRRPPYIVQEESL